MRTMLPHPTRSPLTLLVPLLALVASQASAFPGILNDWQARYGAISPSGENADCQLCHGDPGGGSPWNAYGWDVLMALEDPSCDLESDGVSNEEAFFCIEALNSDGDTGSYDNVTEIGLGTQPGWTVGASNTLFTRSGSTSGHTAPGDIGPVDPDGTEPPPPPPPPPPSDDEPMGPPRLLQLVRPGDSLQKAIDRAAPNGAILVLPGVYRELTDPTNALNISKSGLRLIGLSSPRRRVVLQNAGNQRNGIAVVPPERTDCMGCHESMAPPFELLPGVEGGRGDSEPVIYGFSISGFTIQGFRNNGLFTERVDGFSIIDVESVDNRNYGIFPTRSRNGIVARSRASGSDDSGIWVETSERVWVVGNHVEGNVNGFEVSNSDDIVLAFNEAVGNAIGAAILLLPDIYDEHPGARRIDLWGNRFHDNNKANTARPGSILSMVPPGIGILHVGVDDSRLVGNHIENNNFVGIGIVDYCAVVFGTPFDCQLDPSISPEFVDDQGAESNRVMHNTLVHNGASPGAGNPFGFAASDLGLLTVGDAGNCFEGNTFTKFFSLIGVLPTCE